MSTSEGYKAYKVEARIGGEKKKIASECDYGVPSKKREKKLKATGEPLVEESGI